VNLLETLLNEGNGNVVQQMAKSLGMSDTDAKKGIEALTPALSRGISRNARQPGGLESLLGALQGGKHQSYVDDPETLGQSDSIADGNSILGHILGSKDVSRNVAGAAAQQTGLDSGMLKKMLPMLAGAVMGTMGKQASNQGIMGQQGAGGGLMGQVAGMLGGAGGGADAGVAGMLESFLDSDRDGAVVDDLLTMAKKFF
jgi:hypothetical protein